MQYISAIMKKNSHLKKSIEHKYTMKEFMGAYLEKQRDGIIWDSLVIDCINEEKLSLIRIIRDIEKDCMLKSCIVLITEAMVDQADYLIINMENEE